MNVQLAKARRAKERAKEEQGWDKVEERALRAEIRTLWKTAVKPAAVPSHGATYVICMSDWQVGKGEGGGSKATMDRVKAAFAAARDRLITLRAAGVRVERIALIGLGDLHEGTCGFYPMQEYSIDLDRRGQNRVVRRLLLFGLRMFAEFGLPVVIGGVAGNHGENRREGKAFTTFADNDDVAVFEAVADIVEEHPQAFGSPVFEIPTADLTMTLELSGVRVAFAHGHQFRRGGTLPQAKALGWWREQALGNQPPGAARILISGHFHHFSVIVHGDRTHLQCPTMDGGSQWFRETSGVDSPAGMLTLLVGHTRGSLQWSDLQVVS